MPIKTPGNFFLYEQHEWDKLQEEYEKLEWMLADVISKILNANMFKFMFVTSQDRLTDLLEKDHIEWWESYKSRSE